MTEFFNSMVGFDQTLWYMAIFSSIIFLIQTIMIFAGGDVETDTETGTDVDHAQEDVGKTFAWLSFKNLINFLLIFSWVGISSSNSGFSTGWTLLISTASGVLFAGIMTLLFTLMNKLSQDGTTNITSTIGKIGTVYLTIPKKGDGLGKVNIMVGDTHKIMDAMTNYDTIKTGTVITVSDVVNGILVVNVR